MMKRGSVHDEVWGKSHRLPRAKRFFCRKYRQDLNVFSQVTECVFDTRLFSQRELYLVLVRRTVREDLMDERGLMVEEHHCRLERLG